MKKIMPLTLVFLLVFSTTSIYAAESENTNTRAINNYQDSLTVTDGQQFRTTNISDSCVIDIESSTKTQCTYDQRTVYVNGAEFITYSDNVEVMPRAGYSRSSSPALGVPSDYTVEQGTTKKNVEFNVSAQ